MFLHHAVSRDVVRFRMCNSYWNVCVCVVGRQGQSLAQAALKLTSILMPVSQAWIKY